MKRSMIAFAALLFVCGATLAQAALVTLNAEVHDYQGNLVNGYRDVAVKIYSTSTGGTILWGEYHTSVQIVNGQFSIQVGSLTSGGVPSQYLTGYYVGVSVSGIGISELEPRIQTVDDKTTWIGFW